MAFESLASGPFSGGFARGAGIKLARNQQKLDKQALQQKQAEAQQKRLADLLQQHKENALNTAMQLTQSAIELKKQNRDGTPEYENIVSGIPAALQDYGQFLDEFQAKAAMTDPQMAQAMPSGKKFVEDNMRVFQSQIEAAQPADTEGQTWINFRNPANGEERSVLAGSETAKSLAGGGWVRVGLISRQLQTDDPSALFGDPRTPSQRGADYSDNLLQFNSSSNVQEMIGSVLPRVMDMPGAVGTRGKVATLLSGAASALGQDQLAQHISDVISSASPEEISSIMAQLQATRGELTPLVTGQESRARLSEGEREMADKAVALIDQIKGPADLTRSYPQVIGALRQFYVESLTKQYRLAKQDPAINYPYDLNDDDDVNELVDLALQSGLDEQTIRSMLSRLAKIQGIQ